jgi:hypothetical protein
VTLVVPFPPGGSTDLIARTLAPKLQEKLGGRFVVDNKAGANGTIAVEAVAKSPADGYMLTMISSSHSVNVTLQSRHPYDLEKDVIPITQATTQPYCLVVNPALPVRTLQERLIRDASAPAAMVPLWDTPWYADDWAERQLQLLDAPELLGSDGHLADGFARPLDPRSGSTERQEALWSGMVHPDGQGGFQIRLDPAPALEAGGNGARTWPLITLEPGLNRWLQDLDRPTPARLLGCANPWGPWLRASRLAPD